MRWQRFLPKPFALRVRARVLRSLFDHGDRLEGGVTLFVVRHAPTLLSGVCYGRTDVPVAPAADEASLVALASLERSGQADSPPFGHVFTSPSARAKTLATAIARRLALSPPCVDPRLAELDFGAWEGRPWSEIERDDGSRLSAWMADWEHVRVPNGEAASDLVERIERFVDELRVSGVRPLLVTHAGPIRVLRALARRWTLAQVWVEPVAHLTIEAITTG